MFKDQIIETTGMSLPSLYVCIVRDMKDRFYNKIVRKSLNEPYEHVILVLNLFEGSYPLHSFFPDFHYASWEEVNDYKIDSYSQIALSREMKEKLFKFIEMNLGKKYGLLTDIPRAALEIVKGRVRRIGESIFGSPIYPIERRKGIENNTLICSEAGIRAYDAIYGKEAVDDALFKLKLPIDRNAINPHHLHRFMYYFDKPRHKYKKLV